MFAPHHFGLTDLDYKFIGQFLLIAIPFAFVAFVVLMSKPNRDNNNNDNDKNDPSIPSPS